MGKLDGHEHKQFGRLKRGRKFEWQEPGEAKISLTPLVGQACSQSDWYELHNVVCTMYMRELYVWCARANTRWHNNNNNIKITKVCISGRLPKLQNCNA